MKKFFNILVVFVLCFLTVGVESEVFAINSCENDTKLIVNYNNLKSEYVVGDQSNSFSITISNLRVNANYTLTQPGSAGSHSATGESLDGNSASSGTVTFNSKPGSFLKIASYNFVLSGPGIAKCQLEQGFIVSDAWLTCTETTVWQENQIGEICDNRCLNTELPIHIKTQMTQSNGTIVPGGSKFFHNFKGSGNIQSSNTDKNGYFETIHDSLVKDTYEFYIQKNGTIYGQSICTKKLTTDLDCECKIVDSEDDLNHQDNTNDLLPFSLCRQIPDGYKFDKQKAECLKCTGGIEDNEENKGIWTAIGCISRDPQSIMQKLIKVGVGISGGVALITFLASGFIFSTSQGDPKAYGKAKEMMTSAIVGLLFIIFSVTVLQFVGYQILKIPGFGGP